MREENKQTKWTEESSDKLTLKSQRQKQQTTLVRSERETISEFVQTTNGLVERDMIFPGIPALCTL